MFALAVGAVLTLRSQLFYPYPPPAASSTAPLVLATSTPPHAPKAATTTAAVVPTVPHVPFFSQFRDIALPEWQKVGCGVTSLAMLINYYVPGSVSVEKLLQEGVKAGAYDDTRGWTYEGLISLAKKYGLKGSYYDLSGYSSKKAVSKFKTLAAAGPVILDVHNKFDPASTVPHLIVIEGIKGNEVYYNDPAGKKGRKIISLTKLTDAWNAKVIAIRPGKKLSTPKPAPLAAETKKP